MRGTGKSIGATKIALVVTVALAIAWIATGLSVALSLHHVRMPGLFGWSMTVADANARAANALLLEQMRSDTSDTRGLARVADLARRALAREPGNVAAIRTLGLVEKLRGHALTSDRLFTFAESMSRRDLQTQLWLIERRVDDDSAAGALVHYDRAMRVSVSSRELLLPILAGAASDPAITDLLSGLVAKRPSWWPNFIEALLKGKDPKAIAYIVSRLRLDPHRVADRWWLNASLRRLVELGAYGPARTIYDAAMPGEAGATIRDGMFRRSLLGPFEWAMTEQTGLAAGVGPVDDVGVGMALTLSADPGQGGEMARQMLMLEPGQYVLNAHVGGVLREAGARPVIAIRCVDRSGMGREVMRADFPITAERGGRLRASFTVTGDACQAQWLTIEMNVADGTGPTDAWVKSIAIAASPS